MATDQADYDAKTDEMNRWTQAIGEAVTGVMSHEGQGLVTARVFFVVRHPDGAESVGNLGITPEDEVDTAARLLAIIEELTHDPENNRTFRTVDIHKQ